MDQRPVQQPHPAVAQRRLGIRILSGHVILDNPEQSIRTIASLERDIILNEEGIFTSVHSGHSDQGTNVGSDSTAFPAVNVKITNPFVRCGHVQLHRPLDSGTHRTRTIRIHKQNF